MATRTEVYESERSWHNHRAVGHGKPPREVAQYEKRMWNRGLELMGDLHGTKILDVACGFGREAVLLAKRGARVVGIDISEVSLEIARDLASEEEVDVDFYSQNIDDIDYDSQFDIVYCRGALHHFPDVEFTLTKCRDACRHDGLVISQEPKAENPFAEIGRLFFNPSTKYEHPFRLGELEGIFMRVFGNVRSEYHCLFVPLSFVFEKTKMRNLALRDIFGTCLERFDGLLPHGPLFKKYSWVELVWSSRI